MHTMLSENVLKRLPTAGALAALLCVPLIFSTSTREEFELPKLIALSLWAVPVALARLLDPVRRRVTLLESAFLLVLAAQALSALPFTSVAWRTSLIGEYENFSGLSTTLALGLWFYGLGGGLSFETLEKASFFAVTAGFLSALYAIGQSLGLDFVQWNPETYNAARVFASLGNPNFLSAYLAMALPLHLSFALEARPSPRAPKAAWAGVVLVLGLCLAWVSTGLGAASLGLLSPDAHPPRLPGMFGLALVSLSLMHPIFRRGLPAAWGGAFLLGLGLVLTGSRGGWLGALVGLALFLFLRRGPDAPPSSPSPSRRRVILYAAGAVLLAAGLWLAGHSFFERLLQSSLHPLESLGRSRLTIWGPAVEIFKTHPWTGVGLDCFKITFPQYSAFDFNSIDGLFVSSRTAHNEWLQAAATTGLPGLAALLVLVTAFFIQGLRRLRAPGSPRLMSAAVLASGAAYLAQNLFSFGVAATLLLWTFLLASVNRPPLDREAPVTRPGAWLLALPLAALLTVPVTLRLAADLQFSRAMQALDYLKAAPRDLTQDQKHALSLYGFERTSRAAELFPWDVKYRLYRAMSLEQLAETEPEQRRARLSEALEAYRSLTLWSPVNGYYFNNCGRVLTSLSLADPSRLSEAEEAQRRAAELSPQSPFFLAQWGALLVVQDASRQAEAPLARAFSLDPDLAAKTLCQSGMDFLLAGNKSAGWRLLDAAATRNPRSPEAWFFRGYFLNREGKTKEARAAMAKALELKPELADAAGALATGR